MAVLTPGDLPAGPPRAAFLEGNLGGPFAINVLSEPLEFRSVFGRAETLGVASNQGEGIVESFLIPERQGGLENPVPGSETIQRCPLPDSRLPRGFR